MDNKIRELKLDEIKAVAGGAAALSTFSATLSTSSLLIKPVSTTVSTSSLLVRPVSATSTFII
jgi:hypothetical protein